MPTPGAKKRRRDVLLSRSVSRFAYPTFYTVQPKKKEEEKKIFFVRRRHDAYYYATRQNEPIS